MTQLSDTQATILSAAAARDNAALFPLPESIHTRGAALDRSLNALLKRGLVSEVAVAHANHGWRTDDEGRRIGLTITDAGLEAIGAEADPPAEATTGAADEPDEADAPTDGSDPAPPLRPTGKLAFVLESIERSEGATLAELTERTGWQPHTTRAALARLRQRGFPIALETRDGRKAYRTAGRAQ